MKLMIPALCAALLLQGAPILAANPPAAPVKTESADSFKAGLKDEVDKLKAQHKDQMGKLRAQQKEQRDKLRADQKQQLAKLKVDQKARLQKYRAQLAVSDSAPAKPTKSATANP